MYYVGLCLDVIVRGLKADDQASNQQQANG